MKLSGKLIPLAVAALLSSPVVHAQQQIIYPSKGQTQEQQNKDQGECYMWAKQQTGVDPVALAQQSANQPAPTGPQGERVKGAAGGAVAGTAIGAARRARHYFSIGPPLRNASAPGCVGMLSRLTDTGRSGTISFRSTGSCMSACVSM